MTRKFTPVNYEETLDLQVSLRDALPPTHLARFVVDIIAQLDLSHIYQHFSALGGGTAVAPEVLLALLFYGYATGVFSSRKIEKATYENLAFRFLAGGMHPDHDTLAHFRKAFLAEIQELFVQILVLAQLAGVLQLGNLSGDGSKIHADASKSQAVSYKHLGELETQLRQEVAELFAVAEQVEKGNLHLPAGLVPQDEIMLREERLAKLAEAKAVLVARAQERQAAEQAEYEAKQREREDKTRQSGHKPRGPQAQPPQAGPGANDQYNFTDPESRIMKNSSNAGFDQHYNAQVGVDQNAFLIVATTLSNHPNDKRELDPLLDAISPEVGKPDAAAFDAGFFSAANVTSCEQRGITPYIATGREPHHVSWESFLEELGEPPGVEATPKERMAYQLRTEIGQTIYRLRKCTVEPVIGIIKEVLGFRQFSLRGLVAATGEWCLVCLAYNLKRMCTLYQAKGLL
jgi:transposase